MHWTIYIEDSREVSYSVSAAKSKSNIKHKPGPMYVRCRRRSMKCVWCSALLDRSPPVWRWHST